MENAITKPGFEPGIADREEFIRLWNEWAKVNGVLASPTRLIYDGTLIEGATAPVTLSYGAPEPGQLPAAINIDLLYGYSEQAKNETMEALRAHQGVISYDNAKGPDMVLAVKWSTFRNPAPPAPPADDNVIGAAINRIAQTPATFNGSVEGYFNRIGPATAWPSGTSVRRGEVTYTLVRAPWQTPLQALFGGEVLVWQRR